MFIDSQNLSKKHKFPYQDNFSSSTCQGRYLQSPIPVSSFLNNPTTYFGHKTRMKKKVFHVLVFLANNHENLYPSHETIASMAGCSIITVRRALEEFERDGLIASAYRHMTTNLYKLADILYHFPIRHKLKALFWAFSFLPVQLLWPSSNTDLFTLKMSDNIKKEVYIYNLFRNMRVNIGVQAYSYEKANAEKEVLVMSEVTNPVSAAIRGEVTHYLRLTRAGQINLTMFHDDAIAYALMKTKEFPAADNRLAYFAVQCTEYSRDKNLPIDYQYRDCLKAMYNISEEARLFLPTIREPSEEFSKAMAAPKPIFEKAIRKPVERMSVPNPHAPKSYRVVKQHRGPLTESQRAKGAEFLAMLGIVRP